VITSGKCHQHFFLISPKLFSSFLPTKFTHKCIFMNKIKYLNSLPVKPEVMSHQKYRQFRKKDINGIKKGMGRKRDKGGG
jgi:hypothetical protein